MHDAYAVSVTVMYCDKTSERMIKHLAGCLLMLNMEWRTSLH